jgi:hypothetical protein
MTEPESHPEHSSGMRGLTEKDMTPAWRLLRDTLRDSVSATVGRVEAAKFAGQKVLEGFGIKAELMGQQTRSTKHVAEEVSPPGLYLGVREGRVQEASRVTVSPEGTTVSFVRMPNFEPGHSPEAGEHVALGGIAYAVGRKEFLPNGTTTEIAVGIDSNGMVDRTQWSGQATTTGKLYTVSELKEAIAWARDVTAEVIS